MSSLRKLPARLPSTLAVSTLLSNVRLLKGLMENITLQVLQALQQWLSGADRRIVEAALRSSAGDLDVLRICR